MIAICEVANIGIGDRPVSGLDLTLDPERQPRRFEVINGAGGRRHWSTDDKARIIAETLEPNAITCEVARRYGLRPQKVFTK
jgi:transposase